MIKFIDKLGHTWDLGMENPHKCMRGSRGEQMSYGEVLFNWGFEDSNGELYLHAYYVKDPSEG